MNGDVKYIQGKFYYEQNGIWLPASIARRASGGGGGLSRSSIISLIQQFVGSGDIFEDGAFALSANGLTGSGTVDGDASKVSYNPLTKVMTFTTEKELQLAHIGTYKNSDKRIFSVGQDDGVIPFSNAGEQNESGYFSVYDSDRSIIIIDVDTNGWLAIITDIRPTEFDITFTQIGAGLDISGQFHLIEQ